MSGPGGPKKQTALRLAPPQPYPVPTSARRRRQHQSLRGCHPPACVTAPSAPVGHPRPPVPTLPPKMGEKHDPIPPSRPLPTYSSPSPSSSRGPGADRRRQLELGDGGGQPSRYPPASRGSLTGAGSAAGRSPPQGSQTSRKSDGEAELRNRSREPFYIGSRATGNQGRKNPNHGEHNFRRSGARGARPLPSTSGRRSRLARFLPTRSPETWGGARSAPARGLGGGPGGRGQGTGKAGAGIGSGSGSDCPRAGGEAVGVRPQTTPGMGQRL